MTHIRESDADEVERLHAGLHGLIEEWAQGWLAGGPFDQRDAYRALHSLLGPAFDVTRCRALTPPAIKTADVPVPTSGSEPTTFGGSFDGKVLEGEELFLRIVSRSEETTLVAAMRLDDDDEVDDETPCPMVYVCVLADDDGLVHYAASDGATGYAVCIEPSAAWEAALRFADQDIEWDFGADPRVRARLYTETPMRFRACSPPSTDGGE